MPISLTKGQRVSLEKDTGKSYDKIVMGLGWDARVQPKKGFLSFLTGGGESEIDLDASVGLFDNRGNMVDQVWFRQLRSVDGSVEHTGDNLSGQGAGDDEQIIVALNRVPPQVQSLVFVVSSYSNDTFDSIDNAFCRMVDASNGQEILRYQLTTQGPHTAMIMMTLYRRETGWSVRAVGETAQGRTLGDLTERMRQYL
ncbi:Stress response protein SCP2 [Candidatus Magnetaquicoccaceae bacterium FCR-1]|uniref:Stress response protein SCP2 n=1 Tax=Candidatus Magnetaquiglobus chichijimensis TaxID=3141448 RepID=A0ABQ0C4A2_9PROT